MIKRLVFLVILNISLGILMGCSDDPASIGKDLLKDDQLNILQKDSFIDSFAQSSSYYKKVIPLGRSPVNRLLLGKSANAECSVLMRFNFLILDTIADDLRKGNINVLSAKVLLTQNYTFGDSTAPFDFLVHSITGRWSDSSFTSDSLASLSYDPADVSSNRNYINDDSLEFNLDNQLVLSWLKAQADTNIPGDYGIYLQPSQDAQKIIGFLDQPELSIIYEKSGVYRDTLKFGPLSKVTLASGPLPQVNIENIVVQNSLEINSRLWFDLSSIPRTALINYAELDLTLDTVETIRGTAFTKFIAVYSLTDSTNNSVDLKHAADISDSGSQYKGEITNLVQNWVNGFDNQGMLITTVFSGEGVELLVFKGSSAADPAIRPRLKIVYTTKR